MKKISIFIFFVFFIPIILAGTVNIGIKMEVRGNVSALFYDASNGVLKINPEFFNAGSIAYKTRFRLDVQNSADIIFTGWSKEEIVMPGERKNFEIYWYTPKTKNVVARLKAYYGKESTEREIKLNIVNNKSSEDVFQIKNFRTYDDYIKFQIISKIPLKNVLIVPKGYITGWVFEQKKIENLNENKNIEIIIPYESEVWLPSDITIDVFSEDGSYYSTFLFNLQKEEGLWKYIHYINDKIILFFNI